MNRLAPLSGGGTLFVPLVHRLAFKLEQLSWQEAQDYPAEAAQALRSTAQLLSADAICAGLDTWLAFSALGGSVIRDSLGRVLETRTAADGPSDSLDADAALASAHASAVVELVKQLATGPAANLPVLAGIASPATVLAQLGLPASAVVQAAQVRRLSLDLARRTLEAGAGGLLLIRDFQDARDSAEAWTLDAEAAVSLANLTQYYETPLILLSRSGPSPAQRAALAQAAGPGLLFGPEFAPDFAPESGDDPGLASSRPRRIAPWLAISSTEVEPDTDPDTIHAWREALLASGH